MVDCQRQLTVQEIPDVGDINQRSSTRVVHVYTRLLLGISFRHGGSNGQFRRGFQFLWVLGVVLVNGCDFRLNGILENRSTTTRAAGNNGLAH
jgi:hypothetical protein